LKKDGEISIVVSKSGYTYENLLEMYSQRHHNFRTSSSDEILEAFDMLIAMYITLGYSKEEALKRANRFSTSSTGDPNKDLLNELIWSIINLIVYLIPLAMIVIGGSSNNTILTIVGALALLPILSILTINELGENTEGCLNLILAVVIFFILPIHLLIRIIFSAINFFAKKEYISPRWQIGISSLMFILLLFISPNLRVGKNLKMPRIRHIKENTNHRNMEKKAYKRPINPISFVNYNYSLINNKKYKEAWNLRSQKVKERLPYDKFHYRWSNNVTIKVTDIKLIYDEAKWSISQLR